MSLRPYLTTILAATCIAQVHAASTSVSGTNIMGIADNERNAITDSFGTPLASGTGLVAVGYFGGLTDLEVDTLVASSSYSTLIGAFQDLASASFGTSSLAPDFDGFYEINASGLAPLDYTNDGGKSLYSFYSNALTLNDATEIGLYRHDDTISTVDPSPNPTDSYTLENFSSDVDGVVLIGTSGTVIYDLGAGPQSIESMQLVLVPEPSLGILASCGLGLLLLRRRR